MSLVADLGLLGWILLAVAAFAGGLSKSAIPALATISVVLGAAVMPARESTGMMLLLFILGDVFAVRTYSRNADWRLLLRLVPTVVVGVLLGAWFLARADDRATAITIGAILLGLILLTLWQRAFRIAPPQGIGRYVQGTIYGSLAGFTTMVANSGGPAMSLYFLSQRLDMLTFLGTSAWFFALLNLVKLPFSIGIGIITLPSLFTALTLLPFIAAGFFTGRALIRRIDQRAFDRLVMVVTILGAAYLIVSAF